MQVCTHKFQYFVEDYSKGRGKTGKQYFPFNNY